MRDYLEEIRETTDVLDSMDDAGFAAVFASALGGSPEFQRGFLSGLKAARKMIPPPPENAVVVELRETEGDPPRDDLGNIVCICDSGFGGRGKVMEIAVVGWGRRHPKTAAVWFDPTPIIERAREMLKEGEDES